MVQNGNGRPTTLADFIWKNADDLWGDFKPTGFGKIILPFTLLRRLECVLEPTRTEVRENYLAHKESGLDIDLILRQITRYPFYNTSEYSLGTSKAPKLAKIFRTPSPNFPTMVGSFSRGSTSATP